MVWQMQHFYVIQQYLISNSNPANIFPLVSVDNLNFIFQNLKSVPTLRVQEGGVDCKG